MRHGLFRFAATVALLSASLLQATPANAQAGDDELNVTLTPHVAFAASSHANALGGGVGASVFHGLNDTVSIGVHSQWTTTIALDEPHDLSQLWLFGAGVGVNLDATWFVPYASLLVTGLHTSGPLNNEDWRVMPGLRAAIGVDFRKQRAHSWGLQAEGHTWWPVVLDAHWMAQLSFRYSWIFDPRQL